MILEGIRVLDFGRYIAGPYCATMLADLGAEVIRIEKVDGSEDRYILPVSEGGEGAYFLQLARNKLGMTLNPMTPEGREIVKKLVATADVVIANLPDETLKAMGLDYQSLVNLKPDIILAAVSAFGSQGPYARRVGFDTVGQAMSGSMHLSGPPETPTRSHVPWVDFGTALLSAYGTLAAIMHRSKTGEGQQVETSLLTTALTFNAPFLIEEAISAIGRESTFNRMQIAAPADAFQTRDGWIIALAMGQPLFERWCVLIGEDSWLNDPRFATDQSRADHGEVLSQRMALWCQERTTQEALARLADARIPAGPVLTPRQTLADPHVAACGFFKPMDYPGLREPASIGDTPIRFSRTTAGIRHRAPTLGEHTDKIMTELGYTQSDITSLRQRRVI